MWFPFERVFKERNFDLLQIRPVKALVLWHGFPYVFQALLLVMFIALILMGLGVSAPNGVSDKLYAKTNLVTLLVWGVWWPVMVWLAVLFGRVWCMVCPLELVSNLSERLGRWLGVRQFKVGKWLLSGVVILIFYAAIQMLIAGVHLHRVPDFTAIFLIFLIGTAAISGLFFENRAYCRAFCTVGLLLNVYGRGGMLAVRPESQQVCHDCDEKWCVNAENCHKLDARSCPTLLAPTALNTSKDCLVCTQCIKSCQPNNMQLQLRTPFQSRDTRQAFVSWPTMLFIMLLSGFVVYELCTEWSAAKGVFLLPVNMVVAAIGMPEWGGWIKGLWTLMLFPLLLWVVLGSITWLMKGAGSLTDAWRELALPMVVVIAAGHMSKGIAKLTSWGGYLPGAMREPSGNETIQTLTADSNLLPASLLGMGSVSVIALTLVVLALFYAIREAKLTHGAAYKAQLPALTIVAGMFAVIISGWG
ncbi:MAG: 4Fe-4S binding protein [Mariprofundaceae bacterium]